MTCFRFVCVQNFWLCLKLNGFVYIYVYVEVFSRLSLKLKWQLSDITSLECTLSH
jgi:hypothetical protein